LEVFLLSEKNVSKEIPSLYSLALSFLRLGVTAFGGPAMIAYIRKMSVEEKKWLDDETFRDGIALCQSIPGATAIQSSAYVGLKARGVPGALVSFISFGLPAFLFMMILSSLYLKGHNMTEVISTFNGLQAIVVSIVANATLVIGRNYIKNWKAIIIALFSCVMYSFKVNPIFIIILSGLLGVLFYYKESSDEIKEPVKKEKSSFKGFFIVLSFIFIFFLILYLTSSQLFHLAILMSRIDMFAFGGGFASLPIMLHEIVQVRRWMDEKTFLNGIAMGQITPGPIVITATFIGYIIYGPLGGLVSTISIFSPSFLFVIGIEPYFNRLRRSPVVNKALRGILCSFAGILLMSTIKFGIDIPWDTARIFLVIASFISLLLKVDIPWIVLLGSVISIFIL